MSYNTSPYDVVFLPYDDYAGQDVCGNYWNVYNMQVSTTHAKDGKAGQLSAGPNMSLRDGITLGGQDFTIDAWLYVDSSTGSYGRIFECNNGVTAQRAELAREATNSRLYFFFLDDSSPFYTPYSLLNTLFHWAFVYNHAAGTSTMYINGVSCGTHSQTIARQSFPNLNIGYSYYDQSAKAVGAVDCFRIADGLARWSADFTPPTMYQLEDVSMAVDTSRKLSAYESISADTRRKVRNGVAETITADTMRRVVRGENLSADTLRRVFDTTTATEIAADTERKIVRQENLSADTLRIVQTSTNISADTSRQLMHSMDVTDGTLQSLEISITTQQVADRVTIVVNDDYDIMEYIQGQYLDYDFKLRVESSSKKGIIQSCQCTSDIDSYLYNGFTYSVPGTKYGENEKAMAHAATHLSAIASGLGLALVPRFDDYVSTMDCKQFDTCYKDLISNLFGWSSRVPQMMINPYIRGDCLYVIQRGHEANVIDISNLKRTMPTINKEITRTMWGTATTVTEVKRTPGVWWTRLVEPLKDTDDTHYDYFLGLLRHKITHNADGSTTTTSYEYGQSYANNKKYLTKETEVTTKEGKVLSERITEHIPLLNGQMETRTYVDGELEGSTVSKGSSNDIPSDFIVKQETVTLVEPTEESQTLPAHSLVDTSFPINNSSMLTAVTNAIKWLNRKTKEMVTMDIYDYDHIIDFNDRVLFNGNTYFVESNVAQKTPRINNQQSLTLVRWY